MKYRICKHCNNEMMSRVGRGLCRRCWDDAAIRKRYPPLCPFGGKGGSAIWRQRKEARREAQKHNPNFQVARTNKETRR